MPVDDFRTGARSIARSGKGAKEAWAELKKWASGHGPVAMKSATIEFMSVYGGNPDAAAILPEVMRSATLYMSARERPEMFQIAGKRQAPQDLRPGRMAPKASVSLPIAGNWPRLSTSFGPRTASPVKLGSVEPVVPSSGHDYLRDMPIIMRDSLRPSLGRPSLSGEPLRPNPPSRAFDPFRSPDTFSFSSNSGESIVRNLINKVRSHGAGVPHHLAPPVPAAKSPQRSQARRKARPRKEAKPAAKRKKAASSSRKTLQRKRRRK